MIKYMYSGSSKVEVVEDEEVYANDSSTKIHT